MLATIEAAGWTSLTQAAMAPEPKAGNRPPAMVIADPGHAAAFHYAP
jgi:hypothetical protein